MLARDIWRMKKITGRYLCVRFGINTCNFYIYLFTFSVQRIRNPSWLTTTTHMRAATTHQQQRAANNTGKTASSKWEVPSLVERFINNKLEHRQSMLSCSRAKISRKTFITAHPTTLNVDQILWINSSFCRSSPFRISSSPMRIITWLSHPSIWEVLCLKRKPWGEIELFLFFPVVLSDQSEIYSCLNFCRSSDFEHSSREDERDSHNQNEYQTIDENHHHTQQQQSPSSQHNGNVSNSNKANESSDKVSAHTTHILWKFCWIWQTCFMWFNLINWS